MEKGTFHCYLTVAELTLLLNLDVSAPSGIQSAVFLECSYKHPFSFTLARCYSSTFYICSGCFTFPSVFPLTR